MRFVFWGSTLIPQKMVRTVRNRVRNAKVYLQIPKDAAAIDYTEINADEVIRASLDELEVLVALVRKGEPVVLMLDCWSFLFSSKEVWDSFRAKLDLLTANVAGMVVTAPPILPAGWRAHPMAARDGTEFERWNSFPRSFLETFTNIGCPVGYVCSPPTLDLVASVTGRPGLLPLQRLGHSIVPQDSVKWEACFISSNAIADEFARQVDLLQELPKEWPCCLPGDVAFSNRPENRKASGLVFGASWARYSRTDNGSFAQWLYFLGVCGDQGF